MYCDENGHLPNIALHGPAVFSDPIYEDIFLTFTGNRMMPLLDADGRSIVVIYDRNGVRVNSSGIANGTASMSDEHEYSIHLSKTEYGENFSNSAANDRTVVYLDQFSN